MYGLQLLFAGSKLSARVCMQGEDEDRVGHLRDGLACIGTQAALEGCLRLGQAAVPPITGQRKPLLSWENLKHLMAALLSRSSTQDTKQSPIFDQLLTVYGTLHRTR